MLAIIEGCDKTGKTTLARGFEAQGYKYLHFSAPKPGTRAIEEYAGFLNSEDFTKAMAKGDRFVLDRFHLGEDVYPILMNRERGINQEEKDLLEQQLTTYGAIVIHATGKPEVVAQRFLDCGEESTKVSQIPMALDLFRQAAEKCNVPTVRYEAGFQSPEAIIRMVKGFHDSIDGEIREAGAARARFTGVNP